MLRVFSVGEGGKDVKNEPEQECEGVEEVLALLRCVKLRNCDFSHKNLCLVPLTQSGLR